MRLFLFRHVANYDVDIAINRKVIETIKTFYFLR